MTSQHGGGEHPTPAGFVAAGPCGAAVSTTSLPTARFVSARLSTATPSAPPLPLSPAPLLLCALLVPLLGFILLTARVPLFQDRYLIAVLPAYLLLVAAGLDWLLTATRRPPRAAAPQSPQHRQDHRGSPPAPHTRHPAPHWWLRLAGLAAVAGLLWLAWTPLRDVVYAAESQKEDWVAAYRYIDDRAREGDVVIVHPGYLRTTADYYRRRLPRLAALPLLTLPSLATADFGERELDAALADLTWGKTRVWLITSPERLAADDPHGFLHRWYEGNTLRFADQRFNGVRVETFSYNGPFKAGLWRPELALNADFGGEISLIGATWDGLGAGHTVRAGDWALLTLRWRALRPLTTRYVVRVRLRDTAGREVAAYDIQPLDGHYPTDRWGREQVWDYHDLSIPAGLTPGRYAVIVGLYPAGQPAAGPRPTDAIATGDPLGIVISDLTVIQ